MSVLRLKNNDSQFNNFVIVHALQDCLLMGHHLHKDPAIFSTIKSGFTSTILQVLKMLTK